MTNVIIIQLCTTSDLSFNQCLKFLALFFIPVAALACSSTRALISFSWEQTHILHFMSTFLISHLPLSSFSVDNEIQDATCSVLTYVQSEVAGELAIHGVELWWMRGGSQVDKYFSLYCSLRNVLRCSSSSCVFSLLSCLSPLVFHSCFHQYCTL